MSRLAASFLRPVAVLLPPLALALLAGGEALAQQAVPRPAELRSAQAQDAEFARLVRQWTTRPEFLSPLVDHLPVSTDIPSPRDVLGYHIGAPRKLTYYADQLRYYRTLAEKSPRVAIMPIGKTDEGREYVVVFISSDDNIRALNRHRRDLAALADPRSLAEQDAREIIGRAKPIYHLIGGLHSGETGPSEMLMELAYRLAVEEGSRFRRIRDNVIVTITPVADPDGRDRYLDWYYRHLVDVTDERERPVGPPYWGRYVFHDNNRDINYSQVTFRSLLAWYLDWHPPIMHDLHESLPFLYTFSGQAPHNPMLDPILYGELPWFSNFEMSQMAKYGMPGVWTHAFVDMWSPGYLAFMSSNHNGLVRMYETFGNGGATTMTRRIDADESLPGSRSRQTTREWYRPWPPYPEVEWSMRNNTNYMQTAVLSALELTSQFPHVVLENFYRKTANSIDAGKKESPHGYVIPAGQRDMTRVELLVNLLRRQGIEVGRTVREVILDADTFPAGSFVVQAGQPYWRLARTLLDRQAYPDPALRTYDDSGWTMGLMLHTDVRAVSDLAVLDLDVEPVLEADIRGALRGDPGAAVYVVAHHGSNHLITLRYRLKDLDVEAADASFRVVGREFPAGSLIIRNAPGDTRARLRDAVESLGLEATALTSMPEVATHEVDLPRLAVYSTWGNTQEVGWIRHALDQFGVPFDLIYKERVTRGALRTDYDMIVVPNQGRTAKGLVFDVPFRGKPLAYTKTERFRFLGDYGESEDITGGMGLAGVLEFERFVAQGGLLVTMGAASAFPADFGITRTINTTRTSEQFYAPGPIVQAEILQPQHPIFYGYAERMIPVRYANGPLLEVPPQDRGRQVLMRYPGGDASVLSGLMRGADEIRNRPAIVDVPVGTGRVLLFATNPCYRWQNHGEFNLLFNAVLQHNDLPAPERTPATSAGR